MSLLYVIIGCIIAVIVLSILIPLKIEINFKMDTDETNGSEKVAIDNYVKIYLLRCMLIKKIKIKHKSKTGTQDGTTKKGLKKVVDDTFKIAEQYTIYEKLDSLILQANELKKLKKHISFQEMKFDLGFNLKEPILNAYAMAALNTLINMYLANNINKINIEKTNYTTYISNKVFDVSFFCIINLRLANTISVIIKLILNLRKVAKKKNGKTTSN